MWFKECKVQQLVVFLREKGRVPDRRGNVTATLSLLVGGVWSDLETLSHSAPHFTPNLPLLQRSEVKAHIQGACPPLPALQVWKRWTLLQSSLSLFCQRKQIRLNSSHIPRELERSAASESRDHSEVLADPTWKYTTFPSSSSICHGGRVRKMILCACVSACARLSS